MQWWAKREPELSEMDELAKSVELALEDLGIATDVQRSGGENEMRWGYSWHLGSIHIVVTPGTDDQEPSLQLRAQLMRLPEGSALPLYRRLLELNASQLYEAAFGVDGDKVVLTSECVAGRLDLHGNGDRIASWFTKIEEHHAPLASEFDCVPLDD